MKFAHAIFLLCCLLTFAAPATQTYEAGKPAEPSWACRSFLARVLGYFDFFFPAHTRSHALSMASFKRHHPQLKPYFRLVDQFHLELERGPHGRCYDGQCKERPELFFSFTPPTDSEFPTLTLFFETEQIGFIRHIFEKVFYSSVESVRKLYGSENGVRYSGFSYRGKRNPAIPSTVSSRLSLHFPADEPEYISLALSGDKESTFKAAALFLEKYTSRQ